MLMYLVIFNNVKLFIFISLVNKEYLLIQSKYIKTYQMEVIQIQSQLKHLPSTQIDHNNHQMNDPEPFEVLSKQFLKQQNSIILSQTLPKENRSIIANKTFAQGQIILNIHQDYFINERKQVVLNSPLISYLRQLTKKLKQQPDICSDAQKITQKLIKLFNRSFIYPNAVIIYIIEKKIMNHIHIQDQQSSIKDIYENYIKLLPTNFQYLPTNFLPQVKRFHSPSYNSLSKNLQSANQLVDLIVNFIKNRDNIRGFSFQNYLCSIGKCQLYQQYEHAFTPQNIKWGRFILQTRSYNKHCLIPLLDMFNHSTLGKNAVWIFDTNSNIMQLRASKKIEKGDEIFVIYHSKSPFQFLFRSYGFLSIQQNCQLYIQIWIPQINKKVLLQLCCCVEDKVELKKQILAFWNSTIKSQKIEKPEQMLHGFQLRCINMINTRKNNINEIDTEITNNPKMKSSRLNILNSLKAINVTEMKIFEKIINDYLPLIKKKENNL